MLLPKLANLPGYHNPGKTCAGGVLTAHNRLDQAYQEMGGASTQPTTAWGIRP